MAKKILIVDEDFDSSRELASALELHDYEIERVDTGEIALDRLGDDVFDLVLLDIELPRMSGLGVCEKLRQSPPAAPLSIILMSAFFRSAEEIRSIKEDTGARAFLPKPIEVPQLVEIIADALKQPVSAGGGDAISGQLFDTTFPKILRRLSITSATGLLHLEKDKVKKVIYIDQGYPVFARSNLVRECLGQMLLREGAIKKDEFDQSLVLQKNSKRLQGTILIEMGLLTPQGLHEALSKQIEEKLLEIFSWKEGTYSFVPGRRFKEGTTTIQQSPASLILIGIDRYWSPTQTRDYLQPYRGQFLRQVENPLYRFQDIRLNKRGLSLLRDCRGEYTLDHILSKHPLSKSESEKILAALLLSGMLEARQVAAPMNLDEPDLDGQKPSSAKLREQLIEDYSRMMQLDYFELFGVQRDCPAEAIRKSYYQMAKHYHPDQLLGQGLSADVHEKVKELFQRISKAHDILVDDERRANYLDELEHGKKPGVDVSQVLQAETAFQKGLVLLKAHNFKQAAELLEQAAKLAPEEPEYLTYCAWTQYKALPDSTTILDNSLKMLNYSKKINPKLDKTYLYLGYIFKEQQDIVKAQRQFEMALQCNPNCTEALRELRLQEMRQQKNRPSLLGKFFKK